MPSLIFKKWPLSDRLVDFNDMSTCLGLFYAKILGIQINYTFLLTVGFYAVSYWILNRSIWLIDGTLTGTTTPGQSGPGSSSKKELLYILRYLELKPHHHIQLSVIPIISLISRVGGESNLSTGDTISML